MVFGNVLGTSGRRVSPTYGELQEKNSSPKSRSALTPSRASGDRMTSSSVLPSIPTHARERDASSSFDSKDVDSQTVSDRFAEAKGSFSSIPDYQSKQRLLHDHPSRLNSLQRLIKSTAGAIDISFKFVNANAKRNRKDTLVGIITVTLVVWFVGMLSNVVARSPLIFLKLAESQAGENDCLILPSGLASLSDVASGNIVQDPDAVSSVDSSDSDDVATPTSPTQQSAGFSLLNFTTIQQQLSNQDYIKGMGPRWVLQANVTKSAAGGGSIPNGRRILSTVLIVDEDLEEAMELGREWPFRKLGESECIVTGPMLRGLDVQAKAGERIRLELPTSRFLSTGNISSEQLNTVSQSILDAVIAATPETIQVNTSALLEATGFPNVTGLPATLEVPSPLPGITSAALGTLLQQSFNALLAPGGLAIECIVAGAAENPYGKWPSALGNVVLLSSTHFMATLKRSLDRIPLVQFANVALASAQAVPSTTTTLPSNSTIGNATVPPTPAPVVTQDQANDIVENLVLSPTPLTDQLLAIRMEQYAFAVGVQFSTRVDVYSKSINGIRKGMADLTNRMALAVGVKEPLSLQLPLATVLEPLQYLRIFLNQLFYSVVLVVVVLACMAVYSLLQSDVSRRTYEYGMLRALGFSLPALGVLISLRAAFFAIPGIAFGLLLAYTTSLPVLAFVYQYVALPFEPYFATGSALLAFFLGLFMPAAGSIIPMRSALKRTLAESLDVYHQSSAVTTVTAIRLAQIGISASQVTVALSMILIGGIVYIIIPLSFVLRDFDLLLTSLNLILMSVVAGLVLLSNVVQPYAERALASLIVRGRDAPLKSLVLKNLHAHLPRSRKTTLMYTTAVAFVVFAGAMFELQAESLVANIKSFAGSDIVVFSSSGKLDENRIAEYLGAERALPDQRRVLKDFAWITPSMSTIRPQTRYLRTSNLINFPFRPRPLLYAVSDNYLNVCYDEYFIVSETDGVSKSHVFDEQGLDERSPSNSIPVAEYPVQALVGPNRTPRDIRQIEAVAPEGLRSTLSISPGRDAYLLTAAQRNKDGANRWWGFWYISPKVMVTKLPGFFFSSLAIAAFQPTYVVSMNTFQGMLEEINTKVTLPANQTGNVPPKERLLVRMLPGTSSTDREGIINGLRTYLKEDETFVQDIVALTSTTKSSVDLLMLFFYVVAVISCILCFFILWTSFDATIRESLWELGVLRSLGLNQSQLIRSFLYESAATILTALLLGSATGITVAVTLTVQQTLFTELPFTFVFPWALYGMLVVASFIVAVAGAYFPARQLKEKPIAVILKAK